MEGNIFSRNYQGFSINLSHKTYLDIKIRSPETEVVGLDCRLLGLISHLLHFSGHLDIQAGHFHEIRKIFVHFQDDLKTCGCKRWQDRFKKIWGQDKASRYVNHMKSILVLLKYPVQDSSKYAMWVFVSYNSLLQRCDFVVKVSSNNWYHLEPFYSGYKCTYFLLIHPALH